MFELSGLAEMQRELQTAIEAFESLNGEIATIKFEADDPTSIEAAITEAERAIEAKLAPFRGNEMVETLADDLKTNIRQRIYDRAAEVRAEHQKTEPAMTSMNTDVLHEIEHTLSDLRAADYNGFDQHIQKLSRQLHAPGAGGCYRKADRRHRHR